MSATEHALPWEWQSYDGRGHIYTLDGEHVAAFAAPEDMKFALRACNAHDRLVAACEWAKESLLADNTECIAREWIEFTEALAQAKGGGA